MPVQLERVELVAAFTCHLQHANGRHGATRVCGLNAIEASVTLSGRLYEQGMFAFFLGQFYVLVSGEFLSILEPEAESECSRHTTQHSKRRVTFFFKDLVM